MFVGLINNARGTDLVPKLLTAEQIKERLKKLDAWKREGAFITKKFQFDGFLDGIEFVNRVARMAEKQEHHPDVHIRYTAVTLSVQTHSEGGVTEWDLELAEAIDELPTYGTPKHKGRK